MRDRLIIVMSLILLVGMSLGMAVNPMHAAEAGDPCDLVGWYGPWFATIDILETWFGSDPQIGDTYVRTITWDDNHTLIYHETLVEINEAEGNIGILSYREVTGCEVPSAAPKASAPAIWLAYVCEPLAGFSMEGWMTIDTDAGNLPYGTTLYVAASPDGPWQATEFAAPPYVLSKAHLDALTTMLGIEAYTDLWVKASERGKGANLGSLIVDREHVMDDLCSAE